MATVLMVLTSNDRLGDTGQRTGWYLPEAAHPWKVFTDAGYQVRWASPRGGYAPMEGKDDSDPVQQAFLAVVGEQGPLTMRPDEVDASEVDVIFYVGGHGTMWDLPEDVGLALLAGAVHERGGVVAAVCHGPAGLVNVRTEDGRYLVEGRRVAAFTDAEEAAVGKDRIVPFLLASRLAERGVIHVPAPDFTANVVTDGRLVTGQNPASAFGVAKAVVEVRAPR